VDRERREPPAGGVARDSHRGPGVFKALRHKTEAWLHSRWMYSSLGVASFLESVIVPIPLEAVLVPLMQKRRDRLWTLALVALLGCIAGATLGYYVGYGFMQTAGDWFISQTGQRDSFEQGKRLMDRHGFWFIMAVSVMPVPFQIAMLAAGATNYSIWLFLLATLISRGIRYFGLAGLVWWVGDRAEHFVREHKVAATVIATAVVAAFWIGSSLVGGGQGGGSGGG